MSHPQLLFGGSGIGSGNFSTTEQVKALLGKLANKNVTRIDTAARYPMGVPFGSERALGDTGMINQGILADTKILLSPDSTGNGALQKDKIDQSIKGSFERLKGKVEKHIFIFCHFLWPRS